MSGASVVLIYNENTQRTNNGNINSNINIVVARLIKEIIGKMVHFAVQASH